MNRQLLIRPILALVALAALPGTAFAGTVAMVTEVQGGGELLVQGKRAPLQVRALLSAGDALRLADGARAAVAIMARGEVFHAYGPGAFRLKEAGLMAEGAPQGRVEQRQLAAAIRALGVRPDRNAQATLVLRGARQTFEAIAPKGLQLEIDARTLRWRPANPQRPDEWKYRVVLSDDDGKVVFETATGATEIAVPETVGLSRGRPYIYEVIASGPLGRRYETQGEFVLIDAQADERLLRARAAAGDDVTARTLLATAYEEHGLAQAAALAWQALGASAQGRFAAAPPVTDSPLRQ